MTAAPLNVQAMGWVDAIVSGIIFRLYWPLILGAMVLLLSFRMVGHMMARAANEKSALEKQRFYFGMTVFYIGLTTTILLLAYYFRIDQIVADWTRGLINAGKEVKDAAG